MTYYSDRLEQQRLRGLYRTMTVQDSGLADFQSNDYLGYSRAIFSGEIDPGSPSGGATGSRLISGNHPIHEETERNIASYFNAPAALLFPSGYQANLGLLSCIGHRNDILLYDEYIHASVHDGMKLSAMHKYAFPHNDLAGLEEKIKIHRDKGRIIVALESLYSMTGSIPDMDAIRVLEQRYDVTWIIDEAHAAGILGTGRLGLTADLDGFKDLIRLVTFGKAFGYAGAAVLCSEEVRTYLVNFSRPFIYSTAMPPSEVEAINHILDHHRRSTGENQALDKNIRYFLEKAEKGSGRQDLTRNNGPIQYLTIGDPEKTIAAENVLKNAGLAVKAIRPPTVPPGNAGLRVSLHAYNNEEEIDRLFETIG